MFVKKLVFWQYCIKIAGSGWIVLRNWKLIKAIPIWTIHNIIPSPLHNHPTIQNNPDIQSEYTSSEMNIPNEPQNEPSTVYRDAPLIKLPRILQRLANYNKTRFKRVEYH